MDKTRHYIGVSPIPKFLPNIPYYNKDASKKRLIYSDNLCLIVKRF
jgi:hypothetical protein